MYGISLHIKGIYWNDLVGSPTQLWAAENGKSKNPVVAQSHKLGYFSWSSVEAEILKKEVPRDVLASKCKQVKKSEPSFLQCP